MLLWGMKLILFRHQRQGQRNQVLFSLFGRAELDVHTDAGQTGFFLAFNFRTCWLYLLIMLITDENGRFFFFFFQ